MCPGKPVHDVVPLGGYPGAVLVRCRSARAERAPGAGVLVVEFDILCEGSTPPTPAARSAGRADSKIAKTTSPAWTSKRYSSCASNAPSTLMTGAGTCASTTANPVTSWGCCSICTWRIRRVVLTVWRSRTVRSLRHSGSSTPGGPAGPTVLSSCCHCGHRFSVWLQAPEPLICR